MAQLRTFTGTITTPEGQRLSITTVALSLALFEIALHALVDGGLASHALLQEDDDGRPEIVANKDCGCFGRPVKEGEVAWTVDVVHDAPLDYVGGIVAGGLKDAAIEVRQVAAADDADAAKPKAKRGRPPKATKPPAGGDDGDAGTGDPPAA